MGNFFCSDPSNADAIVCYLMPGVMAKLGNFLDKAIRPGTFVVTNTFLFRERRASAVRRRGLRGTVALYIWPVVIGRSRTGTTSLGSEMRVQGQGDTKTQSSSRLSLHEIHYSVTDRHVVQAARQLNCRDKCKGVNTAENQKRPRIRA